ncbi:MAG: hypothetical protein H6737_02765 [Alphaproteobacteria bacterium]|nr:hypothetical protein [Alphaproteobacteria bacterium]
MKRRQTEGWMITLGLCGAALLAALVAPTLRSYTTQAEPEMGADVCVRLGPYECCYDPDDGK